jgi:hypothetical protein
VNVSGNRKCLFCDLFPAHFLAVEGLTFMRKNWLAVWKLKIASNMKRKPRSGYRWNSSRLSTEALETRCLLSATAGIDYHDDGSVHGHDDGGNEWYAYPPTTLDATTVGGGTNTGGGSPFNLADTFFLNSNPGASHTIYLDFDGNVTSGTPWNSNFNGGADFTTPAYNPDGVAGFSNSELTAIQQVWQRVVEDFVAFDVNVTTQEPTDGGDLINNGSGDSRWGVRVAIGGSSYDWYGAGAGGVAYIGSFNWNTDSPTYVFPDQLGNGFEKYVAEAASHEAGHTLGLRHDGTSTLGYYDGHGSGETAWAPIMGVGYYNNLSQWSRGEYADANRLEDDLTIITSQNGFGYRADDYGDTNGTASAANLVNSTTIDAAGIIEQNTDVDVFSFVTGAGTVSIDVQEFERGPNVDIQADLYDSSGSLVTSANPTDSLDAQLNASVSAGTYYLHVTGVGNGDPLTTGYSDYGSIGQYSFTGTIVDPGSLPTLSIGNATSTEGGVLSFTVSLSAASSGSVTVDYSTANDSASAGSDYSATSGTLTFLAGELSKTITVNSLQDSTFEGNESFVVNLSTASGASLADSQGTGTILDDDTAPLPTVSIGDASATEGKLNTKGRNAGTPQLTNMTFTITLSAASSQSVTVNYATADGTATAASNDYEAATGSVTFNAGETSKTITVIVFGDNDVESDESFSVNLSGASNADIGDGSGSGTIINDDSSGGGGGGGKGGGGKGGGKPKKGAVVGGSESESPNAFPATTQNDVSKDDNDLINPQAVYSEFVATQVTNDDQADNHGTTQQSDQEELNSIIETEEPAEAFVDVMNLLNAIDGL